MSEDLVLQVDAEQLVAQFWRDQAEVADSVGERVYTEMPKEKVFPMVRVHQFFDTQASAGLLWLMVHSLQVDVWGGNRKMAASIGTTLRATAFARLRGSHDEGVVTKLETLGWDTTADSDFTPPRPRCQFVLRVWCHPLSTAALIS